MTRPLVSVVIGNHNYGRFLGQCLDSVLAQDFPRKEFEVIVVDDGSTDDSRRVIAGYGERVRPFFQPRAGQATAINQGIAAAQGELLCLLDADDVWLPGKLSACVTPFGDGDVGAVQHRLQDADAELKPLRFRFPDWPARYTLDDFLDGRMHFTATSGLTLRRIAVKDALPIPADLFYYLDDYLTVRTLFAGFQIANIPKVLGLHRVHGGNWCAGGYSDPRKIERDFENRGIFGARLARWMAEAKREFTPRFRDMEKLELLRRRVLYEALQARPTEAMRLICWEKSRPTGFSVFKKATLLLAALSPELYLRLYELYSGAGPLQALRLRLFPEGRGQK